MWTAAQQHLAADLQSLFPGVELQLGVGGSLHGQLDQGREEGSHPGGRHLQQVQKGLKGHHCCDLIPRHHGMLCHLQHHAIAMHFTSHLHTRRHITSVQSKRMISSDDADALTSCNLLHSPHTYTPVWMKFVLAE